MDIRHGRGRGGRWRRGGGGGGGGDGDSGGSGEHRGRGRGGYHRGRGKRDHHRGRGQYHLPAADFRRNQNQGDHDDEENHEEELDNTIFSRRKLKSNWDRYEESEKVENEKDVPTQRGTDYHVLLTSAGDSYAQFRFSDEKDWEMDSLAKNQVPALFIDLSALTQSLEKLPLHTRLNLEPELVQEAIPVQLPSMTTPRRTDSTPAGGLKALQVGVAISSAVKFVPGPTPSPSVSPAIQHPIEDTDTELDLLLSLQKPTQLASGDSITTMDDTPNIPVTVAVEEEKKEKTVDVKDTKQEVKKEAESTIQELTEEDLEDWLDSMIS